MKIWRGLTVVPLRAVPARVARRSGRTRRIGGRHGRAGDAPLDRASTTVGVWTRAVTSARLDRLHQLDGAAPLAGSRSPSAAKGRSGNRTPEDPPIRRLIPKSRFLRRIALLSGGTLLGQLVLAASSP